MSNIRAFIRKEIITILKENQNQVQSPTQKSPTQKRPDAERFAKQFDANKSLTTAAANINNLPEFLDTFSSLLADFNLPPEKFTLALIRDAVVKVLQQQGYK